MSDSNTSSPLLLWPDGAPGAESASDAPPAERAPRLTPYVVESTAPRAAVVVCPGGGYRGRAAHEGEPVARWLNTLGIHAFVLDYRVAPFRHPYPLLDAQRAIRTVRYRAAEWRVDPGRVGMLGFSAGGHLAATAGTHFDAGDPGAADPVDRESSRPDLLVLCYAVMTFLGPHRHEGSMRNLLGDDPAEEALVHLSNERQVNAQTPPAFIWHTAEDAGVPAENSLLFAGALAKHNVPFALHVFPRGRHGLGLANDVPGRPPLPDDPESQLVTAWPRLCAAWLAARGF